MRKKMMTAVLALGILWSGAARADTTFCNRFGQTIWITYGETKKFSGALCWHGSSGWNEVRGWWPTAPGQCVTVEAGCHCSFWQDFFGNCPNPDLHYYAESDDFSTWWGGNQSWQTCTPWNAFDECDNRTSCPEGRMITWGVWLHDTVACNLTLNFNP